MSNKAALVLLFEQGDTPQGTNFADLINSCVNMNETTVQVMTGALNPTEVITPRVSATNGVFTGTMTISGITSVADVYAETVRASAVNAPALIGTTVSASTIWSTNGLRGSVGIVSAAGTTQAAAAPLNFVINLAAGLSDGVDTGFVLTANKTGFVQYIMNAGASANLFPCVGGQINTLSSNAAFPMAANLMYTILHTRASGYAVK